MDDPTVARRVRLMSWATVRFCALCGVAFALLPPNAQEGARDRLCGTCAALPKAPAGPEEPKDA
jgi:hypothetical protein